MEVSVRYHANLSSTIGIHQEELTLFDGATVADLKELIKASHPPIELILSSALVSINNTHAKEMDELQDGDEVILFPPISGGD